MYEVYIVLSAAPGGCNCSEVGYGSDIDALLSKVRSLYSEGELEHIAFTKIDRTAVRQGRTTLGYTARKRAEGNNNGSKAVPPVR